MEEVPRRGVQRVKLYSLKVSTMAVKVLTGEKVEGQDRESAGRTRGQRLGMEVGRVGALHATLPYSFVFDFDLKFPTPLTRGQRITLFWLKK